MIRDFTISMAAVGAWSLLVAFVAIKIVGV